MNRRSIFATAVAALALCAGQAAHAECKLQLQAALQITYVNNRPMVDVSINGKPAHLAFSLGDQTVFWGNALKDYGLKEATSSSQGTAYGQAGQTADVTLVQIHELKAGNVTIKDQYYYILYSIKKVNEAGFFGSGVLSKKSDVELDFEHNAVRFFNAEGCKDDEVVYWGGNYDVFGEDKNGDYEFRLNGKTLKGAFAPGNEVTFVTPDGAHQAEASSQPAGPLPMGMVAGGLIKPIDVSIAVFPELVIGDETIKNMPLAVADIFPNKNGSKLPQVILGADFFRSHRIYISKQQKKVYFTYVGGVPFQDIYKRLGAEPIPAPPRPPKP